MAVVRELALSKKAFLNLLSFFSFLFFVINR